jgi:LL-diaminopimelate aminotransferase
MRLANRIAKLPPYLFAEVSKRIAQRRAEGHDVISLGIGDPDLPTPPHIVDAMADLVHDPANHRYPESEGLPEFRQAVAEWYDRRFDVALDPEKEIISLIGSKEGIGHIALCVIDPGDIALAPDPGYPVYAIGTMFAGGWSYYLPLTEENSFLPDLEAIPSQVVEHAKVLWLNYPNNPTGAVATMDFFERAICFAKKHDLLICHDGPYADVAFDGYKPLSFLEVPGAKEVGIEFNSLSKTYNMTGWRIGVAVGNAQAIDALLRVKTNLDSGVFAAVQRAAIVALRGPQDEIPHHNAIYQRRRDVTVTTLRQMGLRVQSPKASLYIWARIPAGYTSIQYSTKLLEESDVFVTPGIGYGPNGDDYIRISLTTADARLDEAMARLRKRWC